MVRDLLCSCFIEEISFLLSILSVYLSTLTSEFWKRNYVVQRGKRRKSKDKFSEYKIFNNATCNDVTQYDLGKPL